MKYYMHGIYTSKGDMIEHMINKIQPPQLPSLLNMSCLGLWHLIAYFKVYKISNEKVTLGKSMVGSAISIIPRTCPIHHWSINGE